jgi:hypothetical protein
VIHRSLKFDACFPSHDSLHATRFQILGQDRNYRADPALPTFPLGGRASFSLVGGICVQDPL